MAADEIPAEPGIGAAKAYLSEYVNRAFYRNDRVRILKTKKPVAVLVPVRDLERLAVLDTWPTLLAKVDAEVAKLRAESADS